MSNSCPPECKIELQHLAGEVANQKSALINLSDDMNQRAKTSTIIAVTVIVIGVLSGLLSALYFQANAMDRKVDLIREHQVQVMTILGLKKIEIHKSGSRQAKD